MSMGASGMDDEPEEIAPPPPPPPVQQAPPVQPEPAYQPPPQAAQPEPARVVRNDPPPAAYAPPQQPVQVNPYEYRQLGEEQRINIPGDNLDLLMSVPIQITVELGKTRKKIKILPN